MRPPQQAAGIPRMNYGLYVSASGALTSLHRQDVFSNNLANLDTVGFKPDVPIVMQRSAARQESGAMSLPSSALLERLGGGVHMDRTRTAMVQGPIEHTGNQLDVAIRGEGFLVVRRRGSDGRDEVLLTRDGRLALDDRSRLVMAGTGLPVLDTRNRPIVVAGEGEVTIDARGLVSRAGEPVAAIQVADVPDRAALTKAGRGLFAAPAEALDARAPARASLVQGAVEGSAANELETLMRLTSAAGDVAANIALIRYHDLALERAINTLGRVG